ncbi:WD-40 repeat protein [Nostoc sp. NIES-2111]|nr:WD-40 repeat protein [Nostoc sp. NIES-2111]
MAPFVLGQLVYTSFATVGLRTVASKDIPTEIQQIFLEKLVYQFWDAYNPPGAGYRAAYLLQVNPEHSLFGWLYNDGLDDLGRSNVPYFLCYHLAGKLKPSQLENIFICLCTGPLTLINRENPPAYLESLVVQNLWSHKPTRAGVKLPKRIIEQSQTHLEQGKLLNLFVPASQEEIKDTTIADQELFVASTLRTLIIPRNGSIIEQELPIAQRIAQDGAQLSELPFSFTHSQKIFPFSGKLTVALGIIATIASLLTLYFFKVAPLLPVVPKTPTPDPILTPTSTLEQKSIALSNTLFSHVDAVWAVTLSQDGQTLVSASADKTIKVWNLETWKVIATLEGHTDTVRAIALSSDDQTLISAGGDNTIRIWDLQKFKLKRTIMTNSGPVWSLAISNDGQTLVSGHENGTIKIWNFPTGQLLRRIKGHNSRVFSIAMSSDGETFATGSLDKNINIWNLYTGQHLRTITGHRDAVRSLIFSRDGKTLASASWDQSIKLWNVQTGELLHTLLGHTSRVVTLSLGFDDNTLVSGSIDNDLKIWNMPTGKLLETLPGHSDWILGIATNPTKKILVSASKDQTIKVWQP